MKDKNVCIYYTYHNGTCEKGYKNIDLKKCSRCPHNRPRKDTSHKIPLSKKRQKDIDRHDNWKKGEY